MRDATPLAGGRKLTDSEKAGSDLLRGSLGRITSRSSWRGQGHPPWVSPGVGAAGYGCNTGQSPHTTRRKGSAVTSGEQPRTEQVQEAPWSKEARDYALAAIEVVREYRGGTAEYGPEFGQAAVLAEIYKQVQRFGNSNDAEGLASVAVGLVRLGDTLLEWIQAEADNKKTLLADVRKLLPDYEEPGTYPTNPNWSKWSGVLLTIEDGFRDSPTVD